MAYDNPVRHVYSFPAHTFVSSDRAIVLKNPSKGSKAQLKSIQALVTTTCAGGTTTPIIKVGTTVGGAELATINLGTAAAGETVSSNEYGVVKLTAAAGTATTTKADNTGIIALKKVVSNGVLSNYVKTAADADIYVTLVAATGGGAAGVAGVEIEVEWQ